MKTYIEMADSLIARRNEYRRKIKKRRTIILAMFIPVFMASLILLTSFKPEREDDLFINERKELPLTEQKIALFNLSLDDFQKMIESELNDYYGINVFPKIPLGMTKNNDNYGVFKRADGEIYFDTNVINYANDDYTKTINISLCKKGNLIYDVLVLEENEEFSKINGHEVLIIKDKDDNCMLSFVYKDVCFSILTKGLTISELKDVLTSLLI